MGSLLTMRKCLSPRFHVCDISRLEGHSSVKRKVLLVEGESAGEGIAARRESVTLPD